MAMKKCNSAHNVFLASVSNFGFICPSIFHFYLYSVTSAMLACSQFIDLFLFFILVFIFSNICFIKNKP